MQPAHRLRMLAALVLAWMLLPAAPVHADDDVVTVFAASSLTNVLQEIGDGGAPSAKVRYVFAASSLLARQIEAGAEADLVISADAAWMDYLADRQLIVAATRVDLLSNRLVLVAQAGSALRLDIAPGFALRAALGDGRLAVADPETVPAGRYARSALMSLGVWSSVAERLVRAENVRVALAYVARGEAPLGIVYETDARLETGVRTLGVFPAWSHPRIVYPAAVTSRARGAAAKALLARLQSLQAAAVFRRHGFIVLP